MANSKRRTAEPHPEPPIDTGLPTDIKLPSWEAALSYGSLLLAFVLVVRGIASSLWLDETATYWVIKDGLNNLFPRAWEWTGASALYDLTAWASHFLAPVIGFEAALRLPSVLATVVAVYLIYQLGRRLADRRAGMLSAIAFLCIYQVAFAAIDARPYALGLALLLASMLYFLKFLDSPKVLYAIVYVAASALLVYTHYLLALGLVAQLVHGWRHRRKLASLWLAVGALCLPLSGHVLNLYNTRKAHIFSAPPELSFLLTAITPPVLVAAVFLAAILFERPAAPSRRIPRFFLLVWCFFPSAFLFLLATFTDIRLFLPRYLLSAAPALALLAGCALSRLARVGLASATLLVVFTVTYQLGSSHTSEDWRGATAALNAQAAPEDPVLVASEFVEGTLPDINRRDVLYAPQLAYPISHMFRLPNVPIQSALPENLDGAKRVFFLGFQRQMDYARFLAQRLPGYRAQRLGSFGDVVLVRFDQ